eukprot:6180557-Pleurochrysis_carterae.AAC.1
MWRSGHRLGEILRTSDEVTYLLRSDVSYTASAVMSSETRRPTTCLHATRRLRLSSAVALKDRLRRCSLLALSVGPTFQRAADQRRFRPARP